MRALLAHLARGLPSHYVLTGPFPGVGVRERVLVSLLIRNTPIRLGPQPYNLISILITLIKALPPNRIPLKLGSQHVNFEGSNRDQNNSNKQPCPLLMEMISKEVYNRNEKESYSCQTEDYSQRDIDSKSP